MPTSISTMHDGNAVVQLLDVAWGLSYLHNSDIVHGDIKGVDPRRVSVAFE